MKKLRVAELLRLACLYAERDQEEYARCITGSGMEEELAKTESFVAQLRAYRLRRWGATKLEAAMKTMTPVTIAEIAAREDEPAWKKCSHEWGPSETFREPAFNVAYASQKKCMKCGARLFDDWCAMRAGSVEHLLPPENPA